MTAGTEVGVVGKEGHLKSPVSLFRCFGMGFEGT